MHTRYIVAVGALALWIAVSVPAWVSDPLTRGHLLGAANAGHLLLGAIGFVVVGTLYHIIPFVIWVNRYSDLLGLEDVPMIDDLYDDRIAAIDGALLGSGSALIVGSNLLDVAATPALLGGLLVGIGVMAFVFNMVLVLAVTARTRSIGSCSARSRRAELEVSMRRRTDMSHRKNTGEP